MLLGAAALAGCQSAPRSGPEAMTARFLWETAPGDAAAVVTLPVSETRIAVNPRPAFTEYDVVSADVAETELGQCLAFQLTPAAARDLYRESATHPGARLVVVLDHRPLGARRIDRPLTDGIIREFVEVPDAELPALVRRINAAAADLRKQPAKP